MSKPTLDTKSPRVRKNDRKPRKPFQAPPETCAALRKIGTTASVTAGSILFRKGDESRGVFLVLSGRVALSAGDDPTRITRIAEKGSLLGLPATIRQKPYSLTAEAVTDVELCKVSPGPFRQLLSTSPAIGMSVVAVLAEEISVLRRLAVYKA